ncbi:MAG: flagellar basal body P-ring formation chaperone FlgA, partial [Alphaproteobacteria bacterium]
MRLFSLALFSVMIFAGAALAASPLTLRSDTVVTGDVVRIGDLFDNAAEMADIPVAFAPEPGRSVILDAAWLAEMARQYRLDWQPASRFDRIRLSRASTLIDRQSIEAAVAQALEVQGLGKEMEIDLGRRPIEFHVPTTDTGGADIAVRDLAFDTASGRFTAILAAPASGTAQHRFALSGRVHTTVMVPVLAYDLAAGEVVTDDHIVTVRLRESELRGNLVLDTDRLVGSAVRRTIAAGEPLRPSDLRTPVVVSKGSLVTIIYRTNVLTLTAQGRAMVNGASGESIAVMNAQSNRIVDAVVVDGDT